MSGKERFHPAPRYMITLEVQKDCFAGFKGERFRFYLSDEGCRNAKHSEQDPLCEFAGRNHLALQAAPARQIFKDPAMHFQWDRV